MPDLISRPYFVLTLRGDRGPLDRDGVKELMASGEARPEDLVRNAFGRSIGTVAEIVKGTVSDRQQRARTSDRRPVTSVSTPAAPQTMYVLIGVAVVILIAVVWLLAGHVANQPLPLAPTVTESARLTPEPQQQDPEENAGPQPPPLRAQVETPPLQSQTLQKKPTSSPATQTVTNTQTIANPQTIVNGPSGWSGYDIGGADDKNGQDIVNGIWTLRATGPYLAHKEKFHMIARSWTGDGMVTAHMLHFDANGQRMAVSLIMQTSAEATAPSIRLRFGSTSVFQVGERATNGGALLGTWISSFRQSVACPCWIRLVRRKDEFSGWFSKDGRTWTQVEITHKAPPALGDTVLAGIFASTYLSDVVVSATFDNLAVEPVPPDFPPPVKP